MTTKQSSSDPLDGILSKDDIYISKTKEGWVELKQAIQAWHLQKCRSYLPSNQSVNLVRLDHLDAISQGWNNCIDEITKRIGGE